MTVGGIHVLSSVISSTRAAKVSTTKGFVRTRMPGASWPLPMMAFSA
jgi:hypothetical protein